MMIYSLALLQLRPLHPYSCSLGHAHTNTSTGSDNSQTQGAPLFCLICSLTPSFLGQGEVALSSPLHPAWGMLMAQHGEAHNASGTHIITARRTCTHADRQLAASSFCFANLHFSSSQESRMRERERVILTTKTHKNKRHQHFPNPVQIYYDKEICRNNASNGLWSHLRAVVLNYFKPSKQNCNVRIFKIRIKY